MTYKSAKEFAHAVQTEFYEYEQEAEDLPARMNMVKAQYEKMLGDKIPDILIEKEFNAINTKFQDIVDKIIDRFYSIIPSSIKEKFETHFHFTSIDSKKIRAHIRRSADKRFYGIFINSSLITILTKIGKLDVAQINPQCLVYCNRFPNSKPSLDDINS